MSTRATPPRCRGVARADRCHLSLITASTRRRRGRLRRGGQPSSVATSPTQFAARRMRLCEDRSGSFARIPCLRRPRPGATSARTCGPLFAVRRAARPELGHAAHPCILPGGRRRVRAAMAAAAWRRAPEANQNRSPCPAPLLGEGGPPHRGCAPRSPRPGADRPPRICGRWRQGRRTHRPARRDIGDRRPGSARAHASSRCLIRHSSRDWERHAEDEGEVSAAPGDEILHIAPQSRRRHHVAHRA